MNLHWRIKLTLLSLIPALDGGFNRVDSLCPVWCYSGFVNRACIIHTSFLRWLSCSPLLLDIVFLIWCLWYMVSTFHFLFISCSSEKLGLNCKARSPSFAILLPFSNCLPHTLPSFLHKASWLLPACQPPLTHCGLTMAGEAPASRPAMWTFF